MAEPETILEADGLRVVFFRDGDRYAHRFDVFEIDRGEWVADSVSVEGEAGDEWPPSPPFQQLHVERRPTGNVVLLIGMAGKTHWSAAVEVAADRQSITFDVAARVQLQPQQLGSEYKVDDSLDSGSVPLASARGEGPGVSAGLLHIETRHSLRNRAQRIEPTPLANSIPATASWQYAIAPKPQS